MDRASASEAGNVGSTPAGRKFKKPRYYGAFLLRPGAGKLLCLRREAKTGAMFLFEGKARKAKTARSGPKDFYVSKNTVGDLPPGVNLKSLAIAGLLR